MDPLLIFIIFCVLVVIININFSRYKAKKEMRKEFERRFDIDYKNPNAQDIVLAKITEKNEALENQVKESIRILKDFVLTQSKQQPKFFSWVDRWSEENEKIEVLKQELLEIESLAKRCGFPKNFISKEDF